jgi:hypothetical protein
VLPTGRNIGRKTQKWPYKNPSGRKKQRLNFLLIFQKMAEKWPKFFAVCSSHETLGYLQKYTTPSIGELNFFCYLLKGRSGFKTAPKKR